VQLGRILAFHDAVHVAWTHTREATSRTREVSAQARRAPRTRYGHAVRLADFVRLLAVGIQRADARRPVAVSKRSGSAYQAGIGPHTEAETITLALGEISDGLPASIEREVAYPALPRSRCDAVLRGDDAWAIEIKMLRLMGDNGKPNDNMLMHILSPYATHRSALTDCVKLLESGFAYRKAIVIFGYDYEGWPMDPAVEAFETLAATSVELAPAGSASFRDLVHPIHRDGRVFGWEIISRAESAR
jgi:hypothetical protein